MTLGPPEKGAPFDGAGAAAVAPAVHPWLRSYPAGIDWAAPVLREPLSLALDRAVAGYGRYPCLDFLGRIYSSAEVGALVARTARGLQDIGLETGRAAGRERVCP